MNMALAKKFRKQRSKYKQELKIIEERRKKFLNTKHPKTGTPLEVTKLLTTTINYLNPPKPAKRWEKKEKVQAKDKENEKEKPGQDVEEAMADADADSEPEPESESESEPLSDEQRRSFALAKQLASILPKVEKKLEGIT